MLKMTRITKFFNVIHVNLLKNTQKQMLMMCAQLFEVFCILTDLTTKKPILFTMKWLLCIFKNNYFNIYFFINYIRIFCLKQFTNFFLTSFFFSSLKGDFVYLLNLFLSQIFQSISVYNFISLISLTFTSWTFTY